MRRTKTFGHPVVEPVAFGRNIRPDEIELGRAGLIGLVFFVGIAATVAAITLFG